jgi:hypothetical protein
VLAIIAGAVAIPRFYHRVDEELRRHVETLIDQHYRAQKDHRDLKVSLRSAELVQGKGILIHDLAIVEPGAEGPHAELLNIEEALVECPTEWKNLLQADLPIHRVTVRRATLRNTHRPNGTWSGAKLLPPPHFGDRPPEVIVESGVIEIFDPLKTPASTLTLRDVNLSLIPVPMTEPGAKTDMRRLQGMLAGDSFRRVEFEGLVDLQAPNFSIRGHAEGLEISPELRDSLPNPLAAKLLTLGDLRGQGDLRLGELRGQGDLRFDLHYDPTAVLPLKYDISARLVRGRIDNALLPHALTDIRASLHVDNAGYTIDDFMARSAQASLRMTCRASGFEPTSPLVLSAEVRQLDLDRALQNVLPPGVKDHWYKYLPAGELDADVRLSFDGQVWRPEIVIRCLNVSFTHHKFPYRLEHGKGTLEVKDDRLQMSLTAYAGSRPLRLTADMVHPFANPTGGLEIEGDDLQLDESLLAALPPKPQEVVRSLDPHGTMSHVYVRVWRDKPDGPMHHHLVLSANQCSIRYQKFPYLISDIRGTLETLDDNWSFHNLSGSHDKARITCEGRLTPSPDGNELVLSLVGQDVPLGEDLCDALSPHIQQVWRDLRPRGTVDVTTEIRYLSASNTFDVGVRAQPQRDTTSIDPVRFPYRLDHVQGVLLYRDGRVTFQHCKGEHGLVKVSSNGESYWDFSRDGRWHAHLAGLCIDRLRADRELVQALPERLRNSVMELNPTGPINLRGNFDWERTGLPGEPLRSRWDMRLTLQQSGLQCGGILLENLHGDVYLRGGFDGQRLRARGELAIDSLNHKDCQWIDVRGPIWIDDERVLFGSWVDQQENGATNYEATGPAQPPRPITANLFGGTFNADGWVVLGREPYYGVKATLTDADLARCAQQLAAGRHNLRGRVLATVLLKGSGFTRNTLSGKGEIHLSEGDVYQLPVMLSLLKILSIRPPDQNAFSTASINYRIEGEHIYFDRIDFEGDAISLLGKGQMDFQSQIALTFSAKVGRGEFDLPVVKQVFRGASEQLMLIHVDGPLQDPQTRKEALPVVNEALQHLRDELQKK